MSPGTRRRGGELEAAIYDAVFVQLERVGYRNLTMEGVASTARTGKAALYRRWSSKDDLVTDALKHALPEPPVVPDTGTVRGDLLDILKRHRDTLLTCRGAAFRILKDGAEEGQHLIHDVVHQRMTKPVRHLIHDVLTRGAERGEVRPEAATPRIASVGPAVVVYHNLTEGGALDDAFVASVVDEVLMPIVAPAPAPPSGPASGS
ncbi:TetR/AcrR family transcriptional regulator [Actinomadura algeriensis]|uniref:AcrR family transcriptional regulator n=1 Tax=Actinomadura algeriensis TaxID=1679523 RepID=A0ABR9K3H6_9ACTN|nr:TetR/AcrR family transcriptional regulator [Actinomadura algeriensis]MBE1537372.1 AcrR family transcriptional regulator [Actinomadura algeriensis]